MGYYTNKMHYLKRHLLDELSRKRFALDFMQPVDAEALQVPTYYTIIRRPMDVGTIIKRVHNRYYFNVNELIQDFRLIISNCYTFNRPEDLVYRNGQKLEQFFEKVLAQMPHGDELITSRDPKAGRSARSIHNKRAVTRTESQCRDELKLLKQCHVEQLDADVRECFKDKWIMLSKKLGKHHFRSVESFRAHIDEIFAQYRAQARRIFESTYYETMEQVAKHLRNKELNDLLYALGQAQPPRATGSSWHDRLIQGLDSSVHRLQQKLETSRLLNMEQQAEQRRERLLRQQEYSMAAQAQAAKASAEKSAATAKCSFAASSSSTAATAGMNWPRSKMAYKANYVSDVERRAIQQQFVMLPLNTKIEIMHMISQTEDVSTDSCDLQWFDFKNFGAATLNLMKKAMHPHTKLNLRKMKPSEKEDLQRTLEMRLQNINQVLKGNRRKFTHRMRIRSTMPVKKRPRYSTPASKTQRAGNGAAVASSSSGVSNLQKRQMYAAAGATGSTAASSAAAAAAVAAAGQTSKDSSSSDSDSSDSSSSDDSSSDSSTEQSS